MSKHYNEQDFVHRGELIKIVEFHLDSDEFDISILGPKDDINQCRLSITFPNSTTKVSGLVLSKRTITVEIKERFRSAPNVCGTNFAVNKEIALSGFVEKDEDIFENLYFVPSLNKKIVEKIEQAFDELIQNTGMIGTDELKEKVRNNIFEEESIFNQILKLGNYSIEK